RGRPSRSASPDAETAPASTPRVRPDARTRATRRASMTDDSIIDSAPDADAEARAADANGDSGGEEQGGLGQRIALSEIKEKTPAELVAFAEELEVENASNLRKQDLMFAILKTLADEGVEISAGGVLEVLQDGFGFLRSPDANYLPGPDDIYVSPSQIRRFGLRTGDTVDGTVRGPREGERYFALLKVDLINFEDPEN